MSHFYVLGSPTSKVKIWTEDKSILGNWDVRIKKEDLFSGIFSHSYLRFFFPFEFKVQQFIFIALFFQNRFEPSYNIKMQFYSITWYLTVEAPTLLKQDGIFFQLFYTNF